MNLLNYKHFPKQNPSQQIPLFILHGLLGSMDNWRSQAKKLSQTRDVYTLDLRNHGDSPHIKGMSYREMYEDVIAIADHLNLESVHLLGHSMGGKVAMQLALAHPEKVNHLIVVDIAPKPYPLWHQKTLQGVMSAPVSELHSRKEVDDYLKPWIEDANERTFMIKNLKRPADNNSQKKNKGFIWQCNLAEISRGYLKIAGFTTVGQTFSNKTLFIRGEDSNYINEETDTPLIKTLFPHSQIIAIKASAHLPHIQNADEFYNVSNNFFK